MADLPTAQFYKVISENGTDLRREPNMNSKTEDGTDNVICSLSPGSIIQIRSVEVHTNVGHNWYNVITVSEGGIETGWVDSDSLQETESPPDVDVRGGGSTYYSFKFGTGEDTSEYRISDENLTNALRQYIADKPTAGMQKFFIGGTPFFTSQDNINSMKKAGLID